MKKLWLAILLIILPVSAHPVFFKHIGMKEGLSQNSVMSIYQDELGRMWFGTEEGISVYNGIQTIAYKPPGNSNEKTTSNSYLLGNKIFPITGDQSGNIFFVSDGKLLKFNLHFEQFEELIPRGVTTVEFLQNQLWVGVNDSVVIWDDKKRSFQHVVTINKTSIQSILLDSNRNIWIGTLNGLYYYTHSQSKELSLFISDEDVIALYEDSRRNIWVGIRNNGMYQINYKKEIQRFICQKDNPNSISSNQVRCFTEDNFGNILIGTFNGMNTYNPENKTFSVHKKSNLLGSLQRSSIFSIFKDRQGTIWVGTYYGGVHYFNPQMDIFTYYSADINCASCLSDPFVGKMVEDDNNNIWICTEGGGLNFFDRKRKKITSYLSSDTKNSISHNNLKAICYSASRQKLYIGTYTGGLSIFNMNKGTFYNIPLLKDSSEIVVNDIVNHVELFNDQYLILATQRGILKMSLDSYELSTLFNDDRPFFSNIFHIDTQNNIWISQENDIIRINLLDSTDITYYNKKRYNIEPFTILSIYEDKRGRLFFATRGSGLYMLNPQSDVFTHFTAEQNLLQSNYCYEITQSLEGYLIITGDKGISLLDPDKKTLKSVELETTLPLSGFNFGCGLLVCRNGEIFVGGVNGLASFFEEDLYLSPKEYQLYFSSLWVNNEEVVPHTSGGILDQALPYMDHIKLKHYQNNLRLTFTSNNYIESITEGKREYMLSGFDDRWLTCFENTISYTNLHPGKYTLYVREVFPDLHREANIISMDIEIQAPIYATTGAYFLYILLLLGSLYLFFRTKQTRLLLSASLEYERKEKARIEELNQEKIQFFSNISHEFRTPLTLIISQIESLIQNQKMAPVIYNKLLKVYKHSYHMRRLINELLDFRKLEQGYSKLQVSEQNLVSFTNEIFLSFNDFASKENINYQFNTSSNYIPCWFDPNQMQKVIFNLLSNAFKFTKPNGSIELLIEESDQDIWLKVIDNGIGIEKDELQNIFNRFYQGSNSSSMKKPTMGSGLGLTLVKTIIELHHGEINVESKPGYGSIFFIKLQKGNTHFCSEELVDQTTIINETVKLTEPIPIMDEREVEDNLLPQESTDHYSILIVEDNPELLQLLSSLFSPYYKVFLAKDGLEGLSLAQKEMPDIILSDILMPKMSGIELCTRIKSNEEICHIPVVLLTALNSPEQNIEGLSRGAEAYISKPFDSRILLARCNSIIRNRLLIRSKLSNQSSFDSKTLSTNPIDQKFLEDIHKLILDRLSDEKFNINEMANHLGLSRSSFYAKFKTLTGMTPNDFVLDFKLKQSVLYLKECPEMQITEIADQLGFGSARYFSRCFKLKYTCSPAEYRSKNNSL